MISTQLDDKVAQQLLAAVQGLDGRAIFAQVADVLENLTLERFQRQDSPDGVPWAALSPVTLRQRQRRGISRTSILRETGLLRSTVRGTSGEWTATLTVGGPGSWAAVHQGGNPSNTFGGARAPIPARPMIPEGDLPPRYVPRLLEPIEDAIADALMGGT
jgi:phage virion morphogenesis protein